MRHGYETIDVRKLPEFQEIFDFGGELGERVLDAAGSMYSGMDEGYLDDLLTDLLDEYWHPGAEESPKDWSPLLPKEVGPEGLKILVKALQDGELNDTDMFIRDALTFAWEKAMLPTDHDIRDALETAREKVELDLDLGSIWDPLDEDPDYSGPDGREKIINSLTSAIYWGYGMGGEPIIRFHLPDAKAVWALQAIDKVSLDELNSEFIDFRDRLMETFWEALKKEMEDSDPDNRIEFKKQWKEELKDKKRVEGVQKELLEYLKGRHYP